LLGVLCSTAGVILVAVSCFVAILPFGFIVAPIGFAVSTGLFILGRYLRKQARYNSLNRRAGN